PQISRNRVAGKPCDRELTHVTPNVSQRHAADYAMSERFRVQRAACNVRVQRARFSARILYNPHVHIDSSAPTRIDLAGGTLDIWPLYLFHDGAQTLNVAISLRAHCSIRPRADRRIVIISDDTGKRVEADHWTALKDNAELRLLGWLLHHFQVEGLEVTTR